MECRHSIMFFLISCLLAILIQGTHSAYPYYDTCSESEYQCHDGRCIDLQYRCNGNRECPDGDDESGCRSCTSSQFTCSDGRCVDINMRCNGRMDCNDGSDEADCPPNYRCSPSEWECANGQCISLRGLCDNRKDCDDYSDERNCPPSSSGGSGGSTGGDMQLNLKTYPSDQTIKESREVVFRCRDEGPNRARVKWSRPGGRPLPYGAIDLDGRLEIPNIQTADSGEYVCEAEGYPLNTRGQRVTVSLSVEKYQTPRPATACGYHQATCMNGDCISKTDICDGFAHCADGSDEHACSNGRQCNPDQFLCKNTKCVDRLWRCDGEDDCGDRSDEESCDPNPTGSPCRYDEYQCGTGQCVPKSFHCDGRSDCGDGTDEVGCIAPSIVDPPQPLISVPVGGIFNISCRAVGVPTPLVLFRLNWGHVPANCFSTNDNGYGYLQCDNMQIAHAGAYSCEVINIKGRIFVTPDTIVTVVPDFGVCPAGTFNALASRQDECINCFCFGNSNQCKSADLFTYALPPPIRTQTVVGVEIPLGGAGEYRVSPYSGSDVIALHHGLQFRASNIPMGRGTPYLSLPADYQGSQLKSYGGYLKYEVQYIGNGAPTDAPDVVVIGNSYTLIHRASNTIRPNSPNTVSVQFIAGSWYSANGRPATREEIMMTLADVQHILIKLQYIDSPEREVEITRISMDSAAVDDKGLGSASLVEQCICPPGYSGFSCEKCAPGYVRQRSGAWLGKCARELIEERCPTGQFGNPSRGLPCKPCPCPLTNRENNFARSCSLGADNEAICHCLKGYVGRRCEMCDAGYEGNPMQLGGRCTPEQASPYCDARGTLQTTADGSCQCKQHTVGQYCDQCATNTFHLNNITQSGCIECFCNGVSKECTSSSYFRDSIRSQLTGRQDHGFSLIRNYEDKEPSLSSYDITRQGQELSFRGRFDDQEVQFWSLPSEFLGNRLDSYGGYLRYTIRYSPHQSGAMSKNSAPDVVIKSNNDIVIVHYRKDVVQPSGSQTYSAPIWEDAWHRIDGNPINRQNLLMALADVSAILIKGTYTTVTEEAAINEVSLDSAIARNTGNSRALEVEECKCPVGHVGLSCEECAPGYKHTDGGLYLGVCEPCECNGHSDECDAETGYCLNCRDNSAGEFCEVCAPGFRGDPMAGPRGCMPDAEPSTICDQCDQRGTVSCPTGYCNCKQNVVGDRCSECREGTFDLDESNLRGCSECFCSGVSSTCYASTYYREQIGVFFVADKLALTDHEGSIRVTDDIPFDMGTNEASYEFTDTRTYFWRLPEKLLGNQIKSYGGNLQFVVESEGYGRYVPDQDVILRGNGRTLVWSRPRGTEEDTSVTVRIHDSQRWQRIERTGVQAATRQDFLTVLSNLEQILIRATLKSPTKVSRIRDIILDTAVSTGGTKPAPEVETCRCPPGYVGTSCENCDVLHYRNTSDSYLAFGSCVRCPCNDAAESCVMQSNGYVQCNCRRGYTGERCEYSDERPYPPPSPTPAPEITISVTVNSPLIQIIEVGSSVTLDCSAEIIANHAPLTVNWEKLGGVLPTGAQEYSGQLYMHNLQEHDSGIYVCRARLGQEIAEKQVTLTIGAPELTPPKVSVEPSHQTFTENSRADIQCIVSGNPESRVTWMKVNGRLPPTARIEGNYLLFESIRKSDEGSYQCHAQNSMGSADGLVQIYISSQTPTPTPVDVYINPSGYYGRTGDEVQLTCQIRTSEPVTYTWLKDNQAIYSSGRNIVVDGNILVIAEATARDNGQYKCMARSHLTDVSSSSVAQVIIEENSNESPPRIVTLQESQTFIQGQDYTLTCDASGTPYPTIKWSKLHESLEDNVQQSGNTLRIMNARPANRGVYICFAESSAGTDQSSTMVEVEPRERPVLEVHPTQPQKIRIGESVMLSCRTIAGIPEPRVNWKRVDGKPMSPQMKELYPGTITFTDVTSDVSGEYQCTAENVAGFVSATAVIIVQMPPEIILEPQEGDLKLTEGEELKLSCKAAGNPLPQIQWTWESTNNVRNMVERIDSVGESVVQAYNVAMNDAKIYTCTATNEAGTDRKYVNVIVNKRRGDTGIYELDPMPRPQPPPYSRPNPPRPATRPATRPHEPSPNEYYPGPESRLQPYTVGVGDRAMLMCNVENSNSRTIWSRIDGRPLPSTASASRDNSLIIENVNFDAGGVYLCSVIDSRGRQPLITAELIVANIPRITFSPSMPMIVRTGQDISIFCNATGEQPIRVQWHAENHRPLPPSVTVDGYYLRFNYITPADAGRYYCSARNAHGNATKVAEVLVNRGTYVDRPPNSHMLEVYEGDNVDLKCGIPLERFEPGMTFNWIHEGRPIDTGSDTESSVLIVRNFSQRNIGRYYCELRAQNGALIAENYLNVAIKTAEVPSLKLNPPRAYLRTGESTVVECISPTNDYASLIWERADGQRLQPNTRQEGNKLYISNAELSNSGEYVCRCTTPHNQEYMTKYELDIEAEPTHKRQANEPKVEHAEVGSTVILKCDAVGATVKWSRQHGQFSPGQDLLSANLHLNNVQAKDAGTYICTTSQNGQTTDTSTTLVVTGAIPYFPQAPKSYMTFPTLQNAYMRFNFEITFRPERENGLILFNGQKKGSGDYIALSLNDKYPEFRFDFGKEPTIIRSEKPIELGEWHTVKVNRVRKEGFMVVDNQRPVAFPPAAFIGLDLIDNLYLGGVANWDDLPPTAVAVQEGFVGCISRLVLKDKTVELNQDALQKAGTTSCEPCADDPCQNSGVCLESQTEMGYSCICQAGYTGRNCAIEGSSCSPGICGIGRCENTEFGMECYCPLNRTGDRCQYIEHLDEGSLSFKDGSYAAYKTPKASKLALKFNIRPESTEDGVILYVAESENSNGDFAALIVKDKYLELRLNTGAPLKPLIIRSKNPIVPHKWTEIEMGRRLGEGYLRVGNDPQQTGRAKGPARSMYLRTNLYVGGYDKRITINKDVGITAGFQGCISKLEEGTEMIDMIAHVLDSANVQNCGDKNEISNQPPPSGGNEPGKMSHDEDGCSHEPCEHGGTCIPNGSEFRCSCPLGYTGKSCEQYVQIRQTAQFNGDGYIELDRAAFSNSTEELGSFVAILFSTTEPNGLLLWYGQEKGVAYDGQDFLALAIVDGFIEYAFRLDGEESSIKNIDTRVDDGQRHVAIIKRTGNQAVLELDHLVNYGESRPTAKKTIHLPGHLFIGGAPDLVKFTGNRYIHPFNGCIPVVENEHDGPTDLGKRAISAVNVDECPDDLEMDLGTDPPVV